MDISKKLDDLYGGYWAENDEQIHEKIPVLDMSKYSYILFNMKYGDYSVDTKLVPYKILKKGLTERVKLYHNGEESIRVLRDSDTLMTVNFLERYYVIRIFGIY